MPEMHMNWHMINTSAILSPNSFMWCTCPKCGNTWHLSFILPAPVDEVTACMRRAKCHECGRKKGINLLTSSEKRDELLKGMHSR